ncbi:MAG: ATP-binding cassette domain-containing protein, partial [Pedobacter sp.]|nr:ATP-binding cassette domain-containing protein [Pedobacter sp.]
MTELLQLKNIEKRFGGLKALNDVSLTIPEACVYGLIGPNGAGKTTLFNVITGLYQAESGERVFAGEMLPLKLKPHLIVNRGIART